MKIAMIVAAAIAWSFGFCCAGFWLLDTVWIGELESESVPTGKLSVGLLLGGAAIFRALLQDSAREVEDLNDDSSADF